MARGEGAEQYAASLLSVKATNNNVTESKTAKVRVIYYNYYYLFWGY